VRNLEARMNNIIAWLRRNADTKDWCDDTIFYGTYMGHRLRFHSGNRIDIGNKDFDRWANSCALTVELNQSDNISVIINKAIDVARKDKSTYMQRTIRVMLNIHDEFK